MYNLLHMGNMRDERPPFASANLFSDRDRLVRALVPGLSDVNDKYRPWRKVRRLAVDKGVDPLDLWANAKFGRFFGRRELGFLQADERPFWITIGHDLLEPLHRVDRATGGGGPAALAEERGVLSDEAHRRRLRIRTLMDEAAESSLIEGAATTRKDAVDMLRSARAPRTRGERMVLNNYVAMQDIKTWLERPLSLEMLRDLQATLTRDTLDNPDEAGRFRRADENVRVEDVRTGEVIHVPPPAQTLTAGLSGLCDFANKDHAGPEFLHPIVKASILHFLIGYLHPFVDGNGRTARALFYWFALRNGYRLFEFIPISERIRKGFARYSQAYVDTELDEGDLTYFVLYKLDIIELALDDLADHLRREEQKLVRSEAFLKLSKDLNLRQRLLLEHGLRHPLTHYTVKSHMNSNGITAATARTDLEDLLRRRFMVATKQRQEVIYRIAPGLADRLARKGLVR